MYGDSQDENEKLPSNLHESIVEGMIAARYLDNDRDFGCRRKWIKKYLFSLLEKHKDVPGEHFENPEEVKNINFPSSIKNDKN